MVEPASGTPTYARRPRNFYSYGELAAAHATGRTRVRLGWFGRLILQLEIRHPQASYPAAPPRVGQEHDPWRAGAFNYWRDACAADLTSLHAPFVTGPLP